ncbi:MAG: Acetyltransferase domain [Bacillota bacterium]|jgi:RimJ/RimL family protein N-acetyltransferase
MKKTCLLFSLLSILPITAAMENPEVGSNRTQEASEESVAKRGPVAQDPPPIASNQAPMVTYLENGTMATLEGETKTKEPFKLELMKEDNLSSLDRRIFNNPKVMETYGEGVLKPGFGQRMWTSRWSGRVKQGLPIAPYTIFVKGDIEPAGAVWWGIGEKPGSAEGAYLLTEDYWQKGVMGALIKSTTDPVLNPKLYEQFLVITASAALFNPGSWRALKTAGFQSMPSDQALTVVCAPAASADPTWINSKESCAAVATALLPALKTNGLYAWTDQHGNRFTLTTKDYAGRITTWWKKTK